MSTTKIIEMAWMELAQRDLSRDKAPKAGFAQIDFGVGGSPQTLDFQYPEQKGLVSGVLGIFIDNADNAIPVTLKFSGTQQRIVIPSFCQALMPVLSKSPEQIVFDSPLSTVIVPFQFLNFRPEPLIWGARSGGASPSAPTFVRDITFNNMTWGNTALLGGNQALIPANAAGQVAIIKAPATNAAPFWLNWGAAAAVNQQMQMDPGDFLVIGEPGNYDPRAINIAGTAGDRVSYGFV